MSSDDVGGFQVPDRAGEGLLDGTGRMRRTAAAIAIVHELVRGEAALARFESSRSEVMPWGSNGLHFAGRWAPQDVEVLLKVGVSDAQRYWSTTLSELEAELTPHVLAAGDSLSGAGLGWLVAERLPGGLHDGWGGSEFALLMEAGARFQAVAATIEPAPAAQLTVGDVHGWLVAGADRGAPGPVQALLDRLQGDWEFVTRVCPPEVCHGDLHMANVVMRTAAPQVSPALLIDFEPRWMPWVLEAAYTQVLNSDPARAGWQDLGGQMAACRRVRGLSVPAVGHLGQASDIALAWSAVRMWGVLGPVPDPAWRAERVWREQNGAYVHAAVAR